MKLLCNLPLECFAARERLLPHEILTFGPADRMWVDGTFYPYDVTFDPSCGSIAELLALLPRGFRPDALLLWWPDQEPLPAGLEECPITVVGILSDYNITLPYVAGLWPFFDVLLVDRAGVDLFRKLSFADVRWFCQYTFKEPSHRLWPGVARDLDVAFAGNLNPLVQRQRAPWIERLLRLQHSGVKVAVRSGIFGAEYGRFLNRARIGFNRSIRSEMNLRAFEVPACGALLFMERDNLEVRDFLEPGEEVVLYGEADFEELVLEHLRDEPRRARMAEAGHRRIQNYCMGRRLDALEDLLRDGGPGRPQATPFEQALGRGVAMLSTWARGKGVLESLLEAARLEPNDPRPLNALAIALLRQDASAHGETALGLLRKAALLSPSYVPAAANLAWLLAAARRDDLAAHARASLEQRLSGAQWRDLDGPVLPPGFTARAIAVAGALGAALRMGDLAPHLGAWVA